MPITVTQPDMTLDVDARDVCDELVGALSEHWAKSMLAGELPQGGSVPTNADGNPYGRGDGTIARNWETTKASGSAKKASATSAPYQKGGYQYPVRNLVRKGASPVSFEGRSADIIERVLERAAERAVKG